jgi:SnoaL-like domain
MVSGWDPTVHERVLEDFLRLKSSQHYERLLSLFTDNVVYEDAARGAVRHGKDEVRAAIEAFFVGFPDATFELTSPGSRFASGTRGSVEWTNARYPPRRCARYADYWQARGSPRSVNRRVC